MKKIVINSISIVFILFCFYFCLFETTIGSKGIIQISKCFLPGTLSYEKMEGSFRKGIHLEKVNYRLNQTELQADKLILTPLLNHFFEKGNFKFQVHCPKVAVIHPNFHETFNATLHFEQKPRLGFTLQGFIRLHKAKSTIVNKGITYPFEHQGATLELSTTPEGILHGVFAFKKDAHNQLKGTIDLIKLKQNPTSSLTSFSTSSFFARSVKGIVDIQWQDWSTFYPFSGQISKLKGQLKGSLAFDGALNQTQWTLSGKEARFMNAPALSMTFTPLITLKFEPNSLQINGTVRIHEGSIAKDPYKNKTTLSRDVVFIDKPKETLSTESGYNIQSNIQLLVDSKVHYKDHGIDAIFGGKLKIITRPDGLLSGLGRLTIKEGKYRLQGSNRYIHKGRLLYPPGTLLNDPVLDIKLTQKPVDEFSNEEVGLYVQGTLQKPIYHFLTPNSNSKMGFGEGKETGDRALLSQGTSIIAGGASPILERLQSTLGFEEFSLEARETQKTLTTQGGTDTMLVVGKAISRRVYLQYLQSVVEPVSKLRLKLLLGSNWALSADTGTEGLGADLLFSMEKD